MRTGITVRFDQLANVRNGSMSLAAGVGGMRTLRGGCRLTSLGLVVRSTKPDEVVSPIDLRNLSEARAWVADTVARRPWRSRFFDAFADAVNAYFDRPFDVLELGSGPGHLAKVILARSNVRNYIAADFSDAMHSLAREHLEGAAQRVTFLNLDFRQQWVRDVPKCDAVMTMQAAHEVRHKSRLPHLLRCVHQVLRPGGLFLFCDHYSEEGSGKHPDLFLSQGGQPQALSAAGFQKVTLLLDEGGMALYSSSK